MLEHLRDGERVWRLRGKARKQPVGGTKQKAEPKFLANGTITVLQAVERLGQLGATLDELSIFFDCSQPTISTRFREHSELKRAWDCGKAEAQISTRRLLFQKAVSPTAGGVQAALFLAKMLIWPNNRGDDLNEKPSPGGASPEEIPAQAAFNRLTTPELETLTKLMAKLTTPPTPEGGEPESTLSGP
jgi:hypothetical protein